MTCLAQRGTWRLHTGTRERIHTADPDDTDEPALCADLFYVRVPVLGLNGCPLCAADDGAPRSRLTCLLTRELIISAIFITQRAASFMPLPLQHNTQQKIGEGWMLICTETQLSRLTKKPHLSFKLP